MNKERITRKLPSMLNGVVSVVLLGVSVLPLSPAGQFDCGKAYKGFWQKLEPRYVELSGEQLVALTRRALRVYDACQTHDLRDGAAKALFERLDTRAD